MLGIGQMARVFVCKHLWAVLVIVSYLVIVTETESCNGDTNFLVSCQTEWMEEVQNDMAVPTVDDRFKTRDV